MRYRVNIDSTGQYPYSPTHQLTFLSDLDVTNMDLSRDGLTNMGLFLASEGPSQTPHCSPACTAFSQPASQLNQAHRLPSLSCTLLFELMASWSDTGWRRSQSWYKYHLCQFDVFNIYNSVLIYSSLWCSKLTTKNKDFFAVINQTYSFMTLTGMQRPLTRTSSQSLPPGP